MKIGPLRISAEITKSLSQDGNGSKPQDEPKRGARVSKGGNGASNGAGLRSALSRLTAGARSALHNAQRRDDDVLMDYDSPLFQQLSPPLQEQSKAQGHLWGYLCDLPVDVIGVPAYYPRLNRQLSSLKERNLIYPVGRGVFVHIYPDPANIRDTYVPVEPSSSPIFHELMERVDEQLLNYVGDLKVTDNVEERTENLLSCLEQICATKGHLFRRGALKVTEQQLNVLRYLMVRDKEGLGDVEPLINDPYIEDVSCSGIGDLFIEHKIFGGLKSSISFDSTRELDRFVIKLSEQIGRPVTVRDPIVDAVLPDGSRVNIVYGDDVSKRGSNFTIRKFTAIPMSLLDLIELGTLSYEMAAYLSLTIGAGLNTFISGETASGKTTLLNSLTTLIVPHHKIVSIEDTAELQVPHPNWTREVVRGKPGDASSVTMFDLLRSAMRQRPNEIIIGEIRGEEGAVAFQAMQTGHTCLSTFHASSVEKLIQRLTGNPIYVPKTYIDNLNLIIIIGSVRLADGTPVRRVQSINEILGYDSVSESFDFIEVFRWNSSNDVFEFPGYMNSNILEKVVAPKRGLSAQGAREIYDVVAERTLAFKKLHERGKNNFYELHNLISQAYRQGFFR